jgi:hypothetical protein
MTFTGTVGLLKLQRSLGIKEIDHLYGWEKTSNFGLIELGSKPIFIMVSELTN